MRTIERRTLAGLVAISMVAGVPAGAVAQDDAISAAVEAVGGTDALAGLDGFVVEANGTRGALDEGQVPGVGVGLQADYESVSTVDIAGDQLRIDYAIGDGPREVSEVVVGDLGYADGQDGNFSQPGVGPLLSDRVRSIQIHQQLLNPHLLLLDVLADPSIAEAQDDEMTIEHGATPITISLDPESGLPAMASTLENDPLRRDVEVVATYDDWTETASGVSFPSSVTITYDGEVVQQETRSVSTDADIDESMFAMPDGVEPTLDEALAERGDLSHQYLQSFAAGGFPRDGLQLEVAATELAPGVYHLTGGSHHSMAIVQDDGVVVIEAPLDETRSEAILAWLGEELPDQPVTHVVQSHHHVDHSGGLRSMAGATGATVIAGESAVPLYEEAFDAASTVVPDGVDGSSIEIVGVAEEPVTIDDSTNPVTVYPFPNPHAEDYVLVDGGGTLWTVDIFSPGTGAPLPEGIADFVDTLGLDVSQVAGGHGGTATWEELTSS